MAVSILAPAAGALLTGGTALQVRGTAIAGSASDRLDSVRVDLGDGLGWRAPERQFVLGPSCGACRR